MTFSDALKKSFIEGFTANNMPTSMVLMALGMAFLIGVYLFFIYKLINRTALYDKGFHVSMSILGVVTAGIIIAMQSSIVISLGMVGALSIVRFRTAIKDPMDLLFLFWSIGEGIICGAGLFELAIIVALSVTAGILILEFLPVKKKPYVLVVNASTPNAEEEILEALKEVTTSYTVKSRNIKKSGFDMILEVHTTTEKKLMNTLREIEEITALSLLTHEGEIR